MDVPSPGVKNAVMYFNSLTRKEKHPVLLLPAKRKSAVIVQSAKEKLYHQSDSDITNNGNDGIKSIQCINLRQYLETSDVTNNKNSNCVGEKCQVQNYNKPLPKKRENLQKVMMHNKPDLIIQSDLNEMQQNRDANRDGFEKSTNSAMNCKVTRETPDQEAKKILEEFKKEISPYNTFVVPKEVIESDSELIKQTLELFPEVRRSLRNNCGNDRTKKLGKRNGLVIQDEG